MTAERAPDWAMEQAAALRSAVIWQSNASNKIIARALVEAERKGMERAAKRCDQFATVGRKLWNEAAAERPDLHLAQALGAESCAAAIRKLMESSDGP